MSIIDQKINIVATGASFAIATKLFGNSWKTSLLAGGIAATALFLYYLSPVILPGLSNNNTNDTTNKIRFS